MLTKTKPQRKAVAKKPATTKAHTKKSKNIHTQKRQVSTTMMMKKNKQPLHKTNTALFSSAATNHIDSADYNFIQVDRKGASLYITMNRPDLHNAFNEHVIAELTRVFSKVTATINAHVAEHPVADNNPDGLIRSVVLTGAGPSFSAGADLNWMKKMSTYSKDENKQDSLALYDMFKAIYDTPVPVIARVNGVALGGGAGLVAVADIAVAVESAKIGFTEVGIGLVPAVISRFCAEKIGASQAARYFVTGERFGANEAKRIGLVHEVFPTIEEVDKQVDKLASIINGNSPHAVRTAKGLWKEVLGGHHGLHKVETRDYTAETIASIRVSPEGQAGLGSFLNKQPAPWKF